MNAVLVSRCWWDRWKCFVVNVGVVWVSFIWCMVCFMFMVLVLVSFTWVFMVVIMLFCGSSCMNDSLVSSSDGSDMLMVYSALCSNEKNLVLLLSVIR